jgi:hypothetical protein
MKRRALILLSLFVLSPLSAPAADSAPSPAPPLGDVEERAVALLDAIRHDDPARAKDFFLSREAFRVIKAMSDPDSAYDPLYRSYEKDIHKLHAELGDLSQAEFVRVDAGKSKYVKKGEEANAKPYWATRVSSLVYRVGGEERRIELRVMIAWEGRWYITHLSKLKH